MCIYWQLPQFSLTNCKSFPSVNIISQTFFLHAPFLPSFLSLGMTCLRRRPRIPLYLLIALTLLSFQSLDGFCFIFRTRNPFPSFHMQSRIHFRTLGLIKGHFHESNQFLLICRDNFVQLALFSQRLLSNEENDVQNQVFKRLNERQVLFSSTLIGPWQESRCSLLLLV